MKVVRLKNFQSMGAVFILSIRRKRWSMAIQHIYFADKPTAARKKMKLVRHVHSLIPSRKLARSETAHIDLKQDEESLRAAMSIRNRQMIEQAEKEPYQVFIHEKPTLDNLRDFQKFYNQIAKEKRQEKIGRHHMNTFNLLARENALLLTEVHSECGQTLCYSLDVVSGKKAMSYYVATTNLFLKPDHLKHPIRYAYCYLIWHNLHYLKQKGYELYDIGKLTNEVAIREFKLGFGGQIVDVYSGYIAQSKISALLLGVQKWRKQQSK